MKSRLLTTTLNVSGGPNREIQHISQSLFNFAQVDVLPMSPHEQK
jgi:hypothetical protein